ncbi:MAG: hypothetical protein LBV44_08515 [Methylobacillus sp.]|jgi:hypothetical protein|nr:hypothetical protein [Methylobacillus sp.]
MKKTVLLIALLIPAASAWAAPADESVKGGVWESGKFSSRCYITGNSEDGKRIAIWKEAGDPVFSFSVAPPDRDNLPSESTTVAIDAAQQFHMTSKVNYYIATPADRYEEAQGLSNDDVAALLTFMKRGKTLTITVPAFAPIKVSLEGVAPVAQAFQACLAGK